METLDLEIGNNLKDSELLAKLSEAYTSLWEHPNYLRNILKQVTQINLRMGRREPKSPGFYSTQGYVRPMFVENEMQYEIGFPQELRTPDDSSTFVEEVTHLIHILLNPHLQKTYSDQETIKGKLAELGVENQAISINMLLSTDFLRNTNILFRKYEKLTGTDSRPSQRTILENYFMNKSGIWRLKLDTNELAIYAEYLRNSKIVSGIRRSDIVLLRNLSERIYAIAERHADLHDSVRGKLKTDADRSKYMAASRKLSDAQRKLEESSVVIRIRDKILKKIQDTPDDELESFAESLGLNGLVESTWLDILVGDLKKLPEDIARAFVTATLEDSNGKIISRLHWNMRPGSNHPTISNEEWLGVQTTEEKKALVLGEISNYTGSSLNYLVLLILEEEIGLEYCEAVSESAAMSSNEFWDLAEGSKLGSNPDYIKANLEAIQKEIQSSSLLETNELQDLTGGATNTRMYLEGQVSDIIRGKTDLLDTRMAAARAATQTDVRKRYSDDLNFTALQSTVTSHIEATKRILEKGHSVQEILNLTPYLSALAQQIISIYNARSMILEIVAKAVVMYLTGQVHEIADDSGTSPYGIHIGAVDENKRSVWEPFITSIVDYLEKKDSYGFVQILMCKDIPAIAQLIGYES